MKDPAVIYRILELAAQDPPVLLSLEDDATVEDIDEALRIIKGIVLDQEIADAFSDGALLQDKNGSVSSAG